MVIPNPAHDFIQVDMQGSLDKEAVVTVTLTDITGRPVADLYNGKQAGLSNNRLALPSVVQGLYLVVVSSNNRHLKAEKINIR